MESKSNLSRMPRGLNNVQLTEIRAMHEHFIPLEIPHLITLW